MPQISKGLKTLLSSYALAINKQEGREGSLFRQNTKIKHVGDGDIESYAFWCLHYIHMNPVKAGLVRHPGDWKWSSYNEYFGEAEIRICHSDVGRKVLCLDINDLVIDVPRL